MCIGTHPYIPVVNVAQVDIQVTQFDQQMENTVHYYKSSPWSVTELENLANDMITNWVLFIANITSNSVQFAGVKATDLTTQTSASVTQLAPPGTSGRDPNAPLPAGVTKAIKLNTAARGHSAHGRLYFIGLTENDFIDNQITVAKRDAIVSGWADTIFAVAGSSSAAPVIVSLCHNNVWRTTGTIEFVLSLGCSNLNLDSQRRRLSGRGR
jgi:hypothetical protein